MAGRKRNVEFDVLKNIFEENKDKIIDERKKVAKPSNSIWKEIYEQVDRKTTQKAIYNDALRWYEKKTGKTDDEHDNLSDESDISIRRSDTRSVSSDSFGNYSSSEGDEIHDKDIRFSISLSLEVWRTIEPVPFEQKRNESTHKTKSRVYLQLTPGLWTNVLIEKISQHRIKNPCTWSFKRAKVLMEGSVYIKISAKCKTCGALLIGKVYDIPKTDDNYVNFKFIVRDFSEEKHSKKRVNVRSGGSRANEIFSSDKKASVLKREIIKTSGAQMFEPDKGRVISENAIRAGQHRKRKMNKLSSNPVHSLELLKRSHAFGPMIRWLGVDPFFVMYGSPNQFLLYNTYTKFNAYAKITCDATGSIVHKLSKWPFIFIHNDYFVI